MIVASGGRVLNVTARGATEKAQARAYAAVDRIDWRKDSAAAISAGAQ